MKSFFPVPGLAALLLLFLGPAGAEETERQFRAPAGGYWTGTLVDVKGERAIIKTPEGKEVGIPLAKLSEPDQRYIARFVAQREETSTLGAEQIASETKLAATLADAPRDWTSSDGKTLQGQLESFDGTEVQLRTGKGVYKFPASRLSELDQRLLRRWAERKPVQAGRWPEFVEAPADLEIGLLENPADNWAFAYRSPHFEFRTSTRLSTTVVREFARVFEATFELVKALPVGFDPQPPESAKYFLTELYETRNGYLAAGGPEGSGGVFMPGKNKIMIPLPNLGVKQVGNRWILESDKSSSTLNHEIAHQVTQKWLPRWPTWFIEGIAEYAQGVRYNKGRYTLKDIAGDVRDELMAPPVKGNSFPMVQLETLMTMPYESWSEAVRNQEGMLNYRSAHALMFYFLHLDGEGDGSSVATYLRALDGGEEPKQAVSEHLLRGRDYAALSEEVRDKLRSAGIRIEFQ